jgi:hypothetical protein
MFYQFVSLVGAALILIAYIALQRGLLGHEHRSFNALNFVGSALLTWIAVIDWRVGFIVLEGSWALLSIPGMFRRRKRGADERATR